MCGDNWSVLIKTAKLFGRPVNAIAKVKKEDPASIKAIIQDVFVAPNKDNLKEFLLRVPWNKDKIKAPTTPNDAASVAVAAAASAAGPRGQRGAAFQWGGQY